MFGSLMGMGDGFDNILGSHMRQMNNAMSSLFGNPFGNDMFGGGGGGGSFPGRPPSMAMMPFSNPGGGLLSPFPFPNMNPFMQSMSQMSNDPNCHSFSTSSMTTMTTGPDGKPQVYRESSSMRAVPGGVCETKKTVCDSRTGVKKMAIGRHIGDRAHIKEKEGNVYSGEVEENEEFINLDEEEGSEFDREWKNKTQQFMPPNAHHSIQYHQHSQGERPQYLALPPVPSAEGEIRRSKSPQKKRNQRSQPYNKRKEKKSTE